MEIFVLYTIDYNTDEIEIVSVTSDPIVAKRWRNFSGVEGMVRQYKKLDLNKDNQNILKGLLPNG